MSVSLARTTEGNILRPRSLLCRIVLFSSILFLSSHLVTAQNASDQHTIHASITTAGIPFQLSGGFLILVEGRIGPLSKLKFILDTGASRSVVNRKIADKLQLPRQHRRVYDFDRLIRAETADFPDVQFASVEFANVSMLVADLSQVSTFARDADALIGSDFLSRTSLVIDYDEKRVLFGSPPHPDRANVDASPLPLLTVDLSVQHQHLRLLVDSGFPGILLFEGRVRNRIPRLQLEHVVNEFHPGDPARAKKAILPGVQLGAAKKDLEVLLGEAPPDQVLAGIDGLLGIAALKARRIHLDYAANQVSWEPR
jgi:predicted aspartyl protease